MVLDYSHGLSWVARPRLRALFCCRFWVCVYLCSVHLLKCAQVIDCYMVVVVMLFMFNGYVIIIYFYVMCVFLLNSVTSTCTPVVTLCTPVVSSCTPVTSDKYVFCTCYVFFLYRAVWDQAVCYVFYKIISCSLSNSVLYGSGFACIRILPNSIFILFQFIYYYSYLLC